MSEPLTEETVRAAEHLLRTGNIAGLVLLPSTPCPETDHKYHWQDLVADIRHIQRSGGVPRVGIRVPGLPIAGIIAGIEAFQTEKLGVGLYGNLSLSGYGWTGEQRKYLECVFDVPPEPE